MAYSQLEFWELVLATIPREVAVSQWGAEPLVKCFVAVAKLETEIYPVSLPNFFHVMEPIVVREIPAWNPTIVTALTWGLLWRKQALRATVTAVLQFAQDNMATYGKAEVYRLVRLMASLDGDTVREWSPLIKMINRRVDQEHYAYSEHQCKLVEAFCNRFGVHVRIDVTQK
ncbi:hypothetical protein Pmar_PMAR021031 [Perkinsus marinus ATCC 50983]|uniref:Uncharacterized protein n=1 Tax=Perkinsus marinus (strain ATCC 50983 / TXsc) TaxID=423536 RepID=C5KG79_PERM5|nr:hypothetical protein Pmar_PMAR021031 [Perkinsus marinus ATCC 50983]EER16435.1 hypothetical protein Pmar_PMAR021031 [Perkinsus marinus ATCC 50983]|eukprot:XP_002784639.1 hypothetical protein Pmar_PMAR021031 [Perkinsus marinus ATCC 50983]